MLVLATAMAAMECPTEEATMEAIQAATATAQATDLATSKALATRKALAAPSG